MSNVQAAGFDRADARLKASGVEPTLNRILVLSALDAAGRPLSAGEVYDRVLHRHRVNRVTVYRILDLLTQRRVVNKVSTGERSYGYCAHPDDRAHCHFHCTNCGRVQCIETPGPPLDAAGLKASLGLEISNIDLRLDGLCDDCRRQKKHDAS